MARRSSTWLCAGGRHQPGPVWYASTANAGAGSRWRLAGDAASGAKCPWGYTGGAADLPQGQGLALTEHPRCNVLPCPATWKGVGPPSGGSVGDRRLPTGHGGTRVQQHRRSGRQGARQRTATQHRGARRSGRGWPDPRGALKGNRPPRLGRPRILSLVGVSSPEAPRVSG